MSTELVLSTAQLPTVHTTGDFASQCHALMIQQKLTWDLVRINYANLDQIESKVLNFDGFQIRFQYNPTRLTSSAAKVDDQSIRERKCFLCPTHLPIHQRALPFESDYLILANPFPIFPEHFTMPSRDHIPQLIDDSFTTLLELTRAMGSRYTVFYNGPRCGASAPDHLHFQAATRNVMPLELEYPDFLERFGRKIVQRSGLEVHAVSGGFRRFFTIESDDPDLVAEAFDAYYGAHQSVAKTNDEPMVNVLGLWVDERYRLIVFPRAKHRPDMFFAEGDNRILLSPASVDLGGLLVVPVERDFRRLTADHVQQLFQEVCLSQDAFEHLCGMMQGRLKVL